MRFLFILSLLIASLNISAQNAIKNPDFEQKTLNWTCWGAVLSSSAYQGANCVEVTNRAAKWSGMHQFISIPDSAVEVEFSGWMKTANVIGGKESWEKARISIEFLDEKGQLAGGYPPPVGETDGTTSWTQYRSLFLIPQGAKTIKLVAALGNCTGTAWFDDLTCDFTLGSSIQTSTDPNSNQIVNGSFEKPEEWNFFGSQISETAHSGKYGLMVRNSKPEWNGADQVIVLPPEARKILVSGWIKVDSVEQGKESWENARISIELLDLGGNLVNGYPPVTGEAVGTHDWKQFSNTYLVSPSAKTVKIQCALGNATGTAYFDDIELNIFDKNNKILQKGSISGVTDDGQWYPLAEGNTASGGHYVDWSSLLDAPAGKHGFIKVKNGRTVFEDGTPAKFWGTNLVEKDCFADDAAIDSLVNRLSKMGCNLLRLHHMDAPWAEKNIFGKASSSRKLSEASLKQLDYLIFKCKQKGIYIFLDMLVHREFTPQDSVLHPLPDLGGKQVGFFSRKIIDLQKEYATQLLTHINQFTKVAYKDEPAIIGSEFINESTIFTHFSGDILTPHYREELLQFWKNSPFKDKELATFGLQWNDEKATLKKASLSGDVKESLQFLTTLERNYFKEMQEHFRKLGVKYLLSGSNFPQPLLSTLRSNYDMDLILNNQYWDHPQVWKIGNQWERILYAPFHNRSQLKKNLDRNIIQAKSYYKVAEKPFMITEWNHCYPNEYLLEGVPLMAAYAALQGWDGVMQFDFNLQTPGTDRIKNYTLSVAPEHLAHWVMAAPLFLRGDVKTAPGLFVESISDSQIYSLPSYSTLLDDNYFLPYVTKVAKSFSGKTGGKVDDFRKYYDKERNIITSETGELTINGNNGVLQINSPKIQGVTGFLKDQKFNFNVFSCSLSNTHASIYAVSADGKDLIKSKRFYLVAVGPTKMSSQKFNSSRTALENPGNTPVLAQVIEGSVTFKKSGNSKLTVVPLFLDGSRGKPMDISGTKGDKILNLNQGRTQVYEVSLN